MGGFNSVTTLETIVFADNASFDGTERGGALSLDGQLWIGSTTGRHVRKGILTAGTGVTITHGPGTITIGLAGGGVAIEHLTGDTGGQLNPDGSNNFNLIGTANQITTTGAGSTITYSIPTTFVAPGSIRSTTFTTVGTNLNMSNAIGALTTGVIAWTDGTRIHNFGTNNLFMGISAGNGTLSGTANYGIGTFALGGLSSGSDNIAIGVNAGVAINSGSANIAIGTSSQLSNQTGADNTGVGRSALRLNVSASFNTALGFEALRNVLGASNVGVGYQAGNAYTGTETNNICIGANVNGTLGESNTIRIGSSSTTCFIAGIDGVNVGSVAKVVTEASNQLGTATLTAGAGVTITPTANTITIASSTGGFTWSETSGAFAAVKQNGYFITTTATATLPASPTEGDTINFSVDTTNLLTITANTGQTIRMGSTVTASAGTAVNTQRGDAVQLVYKSTGTVWMAQYFVGGWNLT